MNLIFAVFTEEKHCFFNALYVDIVSEKSKKYLRELKLLQSAESQVLECQIDKPPSAVI